MRSYAHEFDYDPDDENADYMWSEGNYSCDCNRSLFFARAAEEREPEDVPCGDDLFSVRLIGPDGAVLYEDDNWQTDSDAALSDPTPE